MLAIFVFHLSFDMVASYGTLHVHLIHLRIRYVLLTSDCTNSKVRHSSEHERQKKNRPLPKSFWNVPSTFTESLLLCSTYWSAAGEEIDEGNRSMRGISKEQEG